MIRDLIWLYNGTLTPKIVPLTQTLVFFQDSSSVASAPFVATDFSGPATYSVSPALPAGLSVNPSNGVVSGTPTVEQASIPYTVTATDGVTSLTATLTISVLNYMGLTFNTALGDGTTSVAVVIDEIGTGGVIVDWGDGTTQSFNPGQQGIKSKTYSTSGVKNVRIYGNLVRYGQYYTTAYNPKITAVTRFNSKTKRFGGAFYGASSLTSVPATLPVGVTETHSMFFDCANFNQNLGAWDTSAVTSMGDMFFGATSFNNGGSSSINNWNTGSVTNFSGMFADSGFNQPIGSWNTSSATWFSGMFSGATAFNQNLGAWNTSSVTTMSTMFLNATSFNNGGSSSINNWNTGSVTSMAQVFSGASAFNQPIGSWNVSSVIDMSSMFGGAVSFNQNINGWNTGSVKDMSWMFNNTPYNQPIGSWNTSSVLNMSYMFWHNTYGASAFNQNIGGWNTSNVTNMYGMFVQATAFNQNIGGWNVSQVNNMGQMFLNAASFNQNLSAWVTAMTSHPFQFSAGANATFANNANLRKPFLQGGVIRVNT